jgi:hypothetical protein
MLVSYGYNRDNEYMLRVCTEVKKRLKKEANSPILWTDEGSIIYGTLVCLYGDYGTSPRSGWFESKEIVEEIINGIDEKLEELWKETKC